LIFCPIFNENLKKMSTKDILGLGERKKKKEQKSMKEGMETKFRK